MRAVKRRALTASAALAALGLLAACSGEDPEHLDDGVAGPVDRGPPAQDDLGAPDPDLANPEPISGVFTTKGTRLISPEGKPILLTGWRVTQRSWEKDRETSDADFKRYAKLGLLGNGQAVQFWWLSGRASNPGEPHPDRVGVYNEQAVPRLLKVLRAVARAGSWIIPSIQVSYNSSIAATSTANGTSNDKGWAHHGKLVENAPVVVTKGASAGTHGRHGDRFFAWLDWLLPKILADKEIARRIAYWETWHYCGHQSALGQDTWQKYLTDFVPRLIAKFRQHDPDRLLGISVRSRVALRLLVQNLQSGSKTPWTDHNWILVTGGYGIYGVLMGKTTPTGNPGWPQDAVDPPREGNEFVFEKYQQLTGRAVHSQEGPGLLQAFRTTPLHPVQRSWMVGLFNLYNQKANGFAIHDWPPSYAAIYKTPPNFDETAVHELFRKALRGESIK